MNFNWKEKTDPKFGSVKNYFAYSTALVSLTTVTLMWPGYCNSSSICVLMSLASLYDFKSSISSGETITLISRPAWIANAFSTPS